MKIGIYVDVNNIYLELQKKYNKKLNYEKYYEYIQNIGTIEKAVAYGVQLHGEAKGFIICLKTIGFNPKFKKSSNWDSGITIDVMRDAENFDSIWLGSSSPNILPLIKSLKKVIIFAANISEDMQKVTKTIEIPLSLMEARNGSAGHAESPHNVEV